MKTLLWVTLCLGLSTALVADELKVVTTTTDLAALAEAIGGELVEVQAIARGSQDPHYVDARPSYMRQLNRAEMLVYNGLELEIGWLPLLVEGSRNRRVQAGAEGALNASTGINALDVPVGELDRSRGDIHPEGNPHYTLSPRNGRLIARSIASRLQLLRASSTDQLEMQHDRFTTRLDSHVSAWEERTRSWRGRKTIAHHKQWEYLADWLGLEIVAYIEEKPGIPPTPRHVHYLVDLIQREQIPVILRSTFVDDRPSRRLADQTDIHIVELPAAVGAVEEAEDYPTLFEVILDRLETGFAAAEGT